jgi:hypothetical protein
MGASDGQGSSQGRPRQEGQPEVGARQEGEVDRCEICHKPFSPTHDIAAPGFTSRHNFTPKGARVDTSQFAPKRSERNRPGDDKGNTRRIPYGATQQATPFDPVLRKALIDKGVITLEDLDRASREIQAFTQAVTGGYDAGTGTRTVRSDAPRPGVRQAE